MSLILVTGAAGLLGQFVVNELLAAGYEVRGFGHETGSADIDWQIGDVTDYAAVKQAMQGVDGVLHLAAVPNIWSADGATIMLVNVQGTYNVFEAAQQQGIQRVVFCSSDSVAGYTVREGCMIAPQYAPLDLEHPLQATDPYALSKVLGEGVAQAYALRGMSVLALRTVFIAYPQMHGEILCRAKDPVHYRGPMVGGPSCAGGGPLHHHIDPRDVARAFRLALELPMEAGEFESIYLSAAVTLAPEPTLQRLARLHGGDVQVVDAAHYARHPYAPLYDLSHARQRLGFVPEYDLRHLLRGLPGFEA